MNYVNHYKIDWQHFLYLLIVCYIFFYINKYSKYSSAEYYLNDQERIQKKLVKDIKVFLKKKKKQNDGHDRHKNVPEDKIKAC